MAPLAPAPSAVWLAGVGGQGGGITWASGSIVWSGYDQITGGNLSYSGGIGGAIGLTKLGSGTLILWHQHLQRHHHRQCRPPGAARRRLGSSPTLNVNAGTLEFNYDGTAYPGQAGSPWKHDPVGQRDLHQVWECRWR